MVFRFNLVGYSENSFPLKFLAKVERLKAFWLCRAMVSSV